jgi:hypothetical protein
MAAPARLGGRGSLKSADPRHGWKTSDTRADLLSAAVQDQAAVRTHHPTSAQPHLRCVLQADVLMFGGAGDLNNLMQYLRRILMKSAGCFNCNLWNSFIINMNH